ncbi:MAG: hypothetical protein K1Y02_00120 [Candidatus Hydrogenedentes bacterium]|nr:hypothetical protein [Candidatus Hydrogenedentota bacterium]
MEHPDSFDEMVKQSRRAAPPAFDVSGRVMQSIRAQTPVSRRGIERDLTWEAIVAVAVAALVVLPALSAWQTLVSPMTVLFGSIQAAL